MSLFQRKSRAREGPYQGDPTKRFAIPECDNPCATTVRFLFMFAYDSTRRDRVESSRWERHDVRRSSGDNAKSGLTSSPEGRTASSTLIPTKARPGPVEKRVAFGSGRALIVSRAVLLAGASTVVAVFFALFTSAPPLLPIVLLTIVLVAYGLLFVLSPLLTEHWVTRSRLILRQGWYFRAVVRFSEIEAVSSASDAERQRVPLGINRPFGQPMLFVTGGRTNLVACRLRKPRRFWQAFGLSAREIVFDVDDRTRFLAAFDERQRLLPPVQPDRAHADLRD